MAYRRAVNTAVASFPFRLPPNWWQYTGRLTSIYVQPGLGQMLSAEKFFNLFLELPRHPSHSSPQIRKIFWAFAMAETLSGYTPELWKEVQMRRHSWIGSGHVWFQHELPGVCRVYCKIEDKVCRRKSKGRPESVARASLLTPCPVKLYSKISQVSMDPTIVHMLQARTTSTGSL